MEIGTAEPIEEEHRRKTSKRPGVRSGSRGNRKNGGGGDGNGGGGGGSGGDKPDQDKTQPDDVVSREKSGITMYFLLLVVVMTFGGLIGAYVVIATNKALEWRPFALPMQVWISTAIILLSSFAYHFGKTAVDREKYKTAKKWFIGTTILGAAFISSQLMAWLELANRGLYVKGNPYAGFFYILTAVHAIHVIGGISALGYVLLRTWNTGKKTDAKRKAEAKSIGWYWHTMGLLWLILLFLLGFWK